MRASEDGDRKRRRERVASGGAGSKTADSEMAELCKGLRAPESEV
jgi:hypothetical protein